MRNIMDTMIVTQDDLAAWKLPGFQRPLHVNEKVRALAERLKQNGGILPGVLTIGVYRGEKYIVDGQHRVEAAKMSGVPEFYADVRICHFESMAEMGAEFVESDSSLVRMRPDDVLRGLEQSSSGLVMIRKECPFIGYDQIRRASAHSPVVSMSAVLRCWFGSMPEVPSNGGHAAAAIAAGLTNDDARQLIDFMSAAVSAWGRDKEYFRLWSSLNLSICMWTWRRMVVASYSSKSTRMTAAQFQRCLMALSATPDYLDWLLGRSLNDRDRSPCYSRIRAIFGKRLQQDMPGKRLFFPSPDWSCSRVSSGA